MTPAPPLRRFCAVWFAYFAALGMFNPYAPLWFSELGFSTLAIGGIASMQAWTRVFAPYAWGWLGDRSGRRVQLVRVAAGASVAAAAALLLADGYPAVALCTVLLFVANGGVVPLSEATLAAHLSSAAGTDTARYGRVRVWGSIGFIVAVVVAGMLLQAGGVGLFPWCAGATYALLFATTLRLPATRDDAPAPLKAPPLGAVLRRPEVAWFFATVFFTVLAHTALYTFFSLYLDDLGYPKSAVGLLWGVSIVIEIAFFWYQGPLFRRVSAYGWLQWAALLSVLRFALIAAFGGRPAVLVFAQMLHAATFAAQHAACIVVINRHFPGPLRGRGQALYTVLGYGISGVLGGLGGGWLSERQGFAAVFWAAACAAAVATVCARITAHYGR